MMLLPAALTLERLHLRNIVWAMIFFEGIPMNIQNPLPLGMAMKAAKEEDCVVPVSGDNKSDRASQTLIWRPTSSVAHANLTIRINFNISRPFSASDILAIYLHAFLQSLHPFEKNCVQGLAQDFH
jgi:hypothetical protein